MGIQCSAAKQHWIFFGRYSHATSFGGQSFTGVELFSFDAKIGSMTDFQSARLHESSAPTATPLIRNVGVPLAPKYHQKNSKDQFISRK